MIIPHLQLKEACSKESMKGINMLAKLVRHVAPDTRIKTQTMLPSLHRSLKENGVHLQSINPDQDTIECARIKKIDAIKSVPFLEKYILPSSESVLYANILKQAGFGETIVNSTSITELLKDNLPYAYFSIVDMERGGNAILYQPYSFYLPIKKVLQSTSPDLEEMTKRMLLRYMNCTGLSNPKNSYFAYHEEMLDDEIEMLQSDADEEKIAEATENLSKLQELLNMNLLDGLFPASDKEAEIFIETLESEHNCYLEAFQCLEQAKRIKFINEELAYTDEETLLNEAACDYFDGGLVTGFEIPILNSEGNKDDDSIIEGMLGQSNLALTSTYLHGNEHIAACEVAQALLTIKAVINFHQNDIPQNSECV